MDINIISIIVTGCFGVLTTIIGSVTSWYVTKRKYNSEVDSNEIENLKNSLKFYEEIVEDNNKKLQFYIEIAEENRIEVYRLKGVIHRLLNNSCLKSSCNIREYYTDEEIRNILGSSKLNTYETKNNINTKKN